MIRNEIKILRLLSEKEDINIRQIAKNLKMDYKTTYLSVKKLEKLGLVHLEKIGNLVKCSLIKKPHPLIFEMEYQKREEFIKNKSMKILFEKLNSLKFPFIALIFGSYAKRKTTKGSDIDLMIICEKNREKAIRETISLLPLDIHLIVLTPEEFLKMLKRKEFNVVNEAVKNKIILIGIEDFYRMIENVE